MQKVESIVTYSGCKITIKKRTDLSLCVYTVEKYEKVESVNVQNNFKTASRK